MKTNTQQPELTIEPENLKRESIFTIPEEIRFIVQQSKSDGVLWGKVLHAAARQWDSPFIAARIVTSRGMVQEEVAGEGMTIASWRACVIPELTLAVTSGAGRTSVLRDHASGIEVAIHCIVVTDGCGNPCGALAMVTDPLPRPLCDSTRDQLSMVVDLCRQSGWDPDRPLPALCDAPTQNQDYNAGQNTPLLTAPDASLASRFRTLDEMAFSLTNSIKTRLNCIEVSLGIVRRSRVRLLAISGLDAVYRRTPGAMRISQAMEECLDHGGIVYSQAEQIQMDGSTALEMPIHQRLRSLTQGSNCVSLTLGDPEAPTAVLTLRRPADLPFKGSELADLRIQFSTVADAIHVLRDARRGLISHMRDSCFSVMRRVWSTSWVRTVSIGCAATLLLGGLFYPWQYSVYVEARLNSPGGRIYSAPAEGRLAAVHVLPGQHVEAGQLLFELETQELENELARLQSQHRMHRVRMVEALATDDASGAASAHSLLKAAEFALADIQRQIDNARVFADSAGIVTRGEGHLRVGERVPLGDAILQIAADTGREIQLRLDDEFAGDLAPGMAGWFAAQGEPNRKIAIEITRVEHQTLVEEGRNLVTAWATMKGSVDTLPLGAEGVARIDGGGKPGWWILLHKPIRKLRWYLWPL